MKLYDLGRTQNAVKAATGLEVSHAYEDLAFVEHSAFLIQFDPKDMKRMFCHFNEDCPVEDRVKLMSSLQKAFEDEGLVCSAGTCFRLQQVEGKEEIRILFL